MLVVGCCCRRCPTSKKYQVEVARPNARPHTPSLSRAPHTHFHIQHKNTQTRPRGKSWMATTPSASVDDASGPQSRCTALAACLAEYSYLLVHCQDLLVHNVHDRLPHEWKAYLEALSFSELALLPMALPTRLDPPESLVKLLDVRSLALQRHADDTGGGNAEDDSAFIGVFRPTGKAARQAKKDHEVERLAALVASVAASAGCTRAIDVGSGKGSLAARLSSVCGLDVVGLEAQESVAATAATKAAKLPAQARGGRMRTWHRTIEADEHAAAALDQICAEAWPRGANDCGGADADGAGQGGVVLCTLHACGDLTPTVARAFAQSARCRALVAVPCCYNLLSVAADPCGAAHQPIKCAPCEPEPPDAALLPADSPGRARAGGGRHRAHACRWSQRRPRRWPPSRSRRTSARRASSSIGTRGCSPSSAKPPRCRLRGSRRRERRNGRGRSACTRRVQGRGGGAAPAFGAPRSVGAQRRRRRWWASSSYVSSPRWCVSTLPTSCRRVRASRLVAIASTGGARRQLAAAATRRRRRRPQIGACRRRRYKECAAAVFGCSAERGRFCAVCGRGASPVGAARGSSHAGPARRVRARQVRRRSARRDGA